MLRFCSNYCKTNWGIRMSVFSAASAPKWAAFYSVWFFFFFFPFCFSRGQQHKSFVWARFDFREPPTWEIGVCLQKLLCYTEKPLSTTNSKGKKKEQWDKISYRYSFPPPPLMLSKIAATRQVCAGSYPAHIVTFINLLILKPRWHGTDEDKVQNPAAR